jgi:hypothetical protein
MVLQLRHGCTVSAINSSSWTPVSSISNLECRAAIADLFCMLFERLEVEMDVARVVQL